MQRTSLRIFIKNEAHCNYEFLSNAYLRTYALTINIYRGHIKAQTE